jgi:hypothetical protein
MPLALSNESLVSAIAAQHRQRVYSDAALAECAIVPVSETGCIGP